MENLEEVISASLSDPPVPLVVMSTRSVNWQESVDTIRTIRNTLAKLWKTTRTCWCSALSGAENLNNRLLCVSN